MKWIYLVRKYAVWLSINLYVLGTTTWLSGMRTGLLKYPCGYETHTMHINLRLISDPLTPTVTGTLVILMWVSFIFMTLDIKYGHHAWTKLATFALTTRAYIWIPAIALAFWWAFKEDLSALLTLLSWLGFSGYLVSCSLLLMKARKA